jgi:hypothetical protein
MTTLAAPSSSTHVANEAPAFKAVVCPDGYFETVTAFSQADFIAKMAAIGHELTGRLRCPVARSELQDQPTFRGLLGPMWDGGPIRYECGRSYVELSR